MKENVTRKEEFCSWKYIFSCKYKQGICLEVGILSKTEYSHWTSPTVYVKKKKSICADYSTVLNNYLENYHYMLLSPKDIFVKSNGGKIISKLDLSGVYL